MQFSRSFITAGDSAWEVSPVAAWQTAGPRRDPYAVLGVEPTASAGQITSAYRKLVRTLHPDAHPGQSAADGRFAEVVAAYGTLHDPAKREAYDAKRARHVATRPQGRPVPVRVTVRVSARAGWPYGGPSVLRSRIPTAWDLLWEWTARW